MLVQFFFKCFLTDTGKSLPNSVGTSSVAIDIFRSLLNIDAMDALEDYLDRWKRTDVKAILGLEGSAPSIPGNASDILKSLTGTTPLEYAIHFSTEDVLPLLARGEDACSGSPLPFAIDRGYVNLIKPLLDAKADVNAKDRLGWTALHRACYQGYNPCLEELVRWADEDVDWDACTPEGKNALDLLQDAASDGWRDSDEISTFLSILQPRVHVTAEQPEDDFLLDMPGAFPMSE